MQPVTEAANALTDSIDVATPTGIVELLQKCDAEIFQGWEGSQGILDGDVLERVDRIANLAANILKDSEHSCVVLSGCGTSGRLGFMLTRSFNQKLKELQKAECFQYIIAGGDKALFTSQEAIEDDPHSGMETLKQACEGKRQVLYIGITCGLSAPFIAGQLEFCLQNLDKFVPVLLGFNPVSLARNNPIERWDKTFLQVAKKLEHQMHCGNSAFIVNPVVGPEPITGSSRMKSGSATKILLEVIFSCAHQRAFCTENHSEVKSLVNCYRIVQDFTYKFITGIARLVHLAGQCLNSGGHIHYIGQDGQGIVGIIDASECPPTYGSDREEVQGFINGGFQSMHNNEGDPSTSDLLIQLSDSDLETLAPTLSSNDLIIYLTSDTYTSKQIASLNTRAKTAQVNIIIGEVNDNKSRQDDIITVVLPWKSFVECTNPQTVRMCQAFFVEMSTKWICNAVTTGGHILKGKVYKNVMVDVKVSNDKLFRRALGIIQKFSSCSETASQSALLRSIYNTDHLTTEQTSASISDHIKVATFKQKVVPIALLLAVMKCSVSEAHDLLKTEPVIRSALDRSLQKAAAI